MGVLNDIHNISSAVDENKEFINKVKGDYDSGKYDGVLEIANDYKNLKNKYKNDPNFKTKVNLGVGAGIGALALGTAGAATLAYKMFKKKNKENE